MDLHYGRRSSRHYHSVPHLPWNIHVMATEFIMCARHPSSRTSRITKEMELVRARAHSSTNSFQRLRRLKIYLGRAERKSFGRCISSLVHVDVNCLCIVGNAGTRRSWTDSSMDVIHRLFPFLCEVPGRLGSSPFHEHREKIQHARAYECPTRAYSSAPFAAQ